MNNNKKKGFTLIELLTVITISAYVLLMITTIYNTLKRSMRRDRAQANVESYIDDINIQLTRTFGSMTAVKSSGNNDTLVYTAAGYDRDWGYLASDQYNQGFSIFPIGSPFSQIENTGTVFGDVRVLLTFTYKNQLLGINSDVSFYRALGISNLDSNGDMTEDSNLVYIEYHPSDGNYRVKKLAQKPSRTWIREIRIAEIETGTLIITLEVRSYLYKSKFIEDANQKHFPQNYTANKVFTLLIRSV